MPHRKDFVSIELLRKSSLFFQIDDAELITVLSYFKKELYTKNDIVYTDGSFSEHVYFVISGSFEIVSYNSKYQNSKQLRILNVGEYFSELSALTKSKHHTSVFALENSVLLKIDAKDFFKLFKEIPKVAVNLMSDIAKLVQATIEKANFFRTLSENTLIKPETAMMSLLPMTMIQKHKVIPLRLEGNHLVIGTTNPLNTFFYKDFRASNPGFEIRTVLMDEAQYVEALLDIRNLHLGLKNLAKPEEVIMKDSVTQRARPVPENLVQDIKNNLLFKKLKDSVFEKILPHLEYQSLDSYSEVITPQTNNDKIYILLSGNVRILKRNHLTGGMMPLFKLEKNDCFYNIGMFNHSVPNLTARATTPIEICIISQKLLNQLFSSSDFTTQLLISLAMTLQKINKFNDGVSVIENIDLKAAAELSFLLPTQILNSYKMIAVGRSGLQVSVATPSPTNKSMIMDLEKALPRYHFKFMFVTEEKYLYCKSQLKEMNPDSIKLQSTWKNNSVNENISLLKPVGTDVVKTLDLILEKAIENRASDIHIEILKSFVIVRYRVDGELIQLWENLTFDFGQSIVRKSKILANLDIAETRLPQGGQFRFKFREQEFGMRISCIPTRYGEKLVLRITGRTNAVIPLRHLSREKETVSFLTHMTKHTKGIFLVTGPTGSGKTTTLYSLLNEMNQPGINIITVEDPIEVNISGINQVEINPDIGLTHDIVLKHILRQDPNVIFIGEIRDATSMQLALEASMTGHLVLSTIHANSALEILPRLKELAAHSSTQIASTLIGVVAQRLVRTLCEDCKVPVEFTDDLQKHFEHLQDLQTSLVELMGPKGCSHCHFTGFKGQLPLFEHWEMTEHLSNLIIDEAHTHELIKSAYDSGFENLRDYGLRMVAFGLTTLEEIDKAVFGIQKRKHLSAETGIQKIKKVS